MVEASAEAIRQAAAVLEAVTANLTRRSNMQCRFEFYPVFPTMGDGLSYGSGHTLAGVPLRCP